MIRVFLNVREVLECVHLNFYVSELGTDSTRKPVIPIVVSFSQDPMMISLFVT